jgi:hypothetical protein
MTVLQRKIKTLTESQQAEVLRFIEQLVDSEQTNHADLFDQKIEQDALSGKLEAIANKAIGDFKTGKSKVL